MSVIHESAENYLESILMLSKKLPVVRSIDVANELGFKKSSVSIAMKNLRESIIRRRGQKSDESEKSRSYAFLCISGNYICHWDHIYPPFAEVFRGQ